MKRRDWHARELAHNPEYAAAAAEVEFVQSIADKLVGARIAAGLTQGELAARAGTTQARISEMESGDGNPTAETIGKVFIALGLTASVLVIPIGTESVAFEVPVSSIEDAQEALASSCSTVTVQHVSRRTMGWHQTHRRRNAYTGIYEIVQRRGRISA